jgi:hypothetical protein
MISTAAKVFFGLIIGTAVCVAFLIALCADWIATETKPLPRRSVRSGRARVAMHSIEANS